MSKSRKTSAAIVNLLDAIKSEGIVPVDDANIMAPSLSRSIVGNNNYPLTPSNSDEDLPIPYQIKLIDTKLCKPWRLANRLQEYLTPDSCSELIESIEKVGQQIPALIRKSDEHEGYELICGARRLFACKHLGIKIKAAVVTLTDKEALLAMDAENRPREDISPYERACDYKRWVNEGIYKNHTEIMEAIGIKKSMFSKIMALAELPEDIVKSFGHPANLKLRWGYELLLVYKSDKNLKATMIEEARRLSAQNLSPTLIFKKLKNIKKENQKQSLTKSHRWVNGNSGDKLFKINYSNNGQAQLIFNKEFPESSLNQIVEAIKTILDERKSLTGETFKKST